LRQKNKDKTPKRGKISEEKEKKLRGVRNKSNQDL